MHRRLRGALPSRNGGDDDKDDDYNDDDDDDYNGDDDDDDLHTAAGPIQKLAGSR